MTFTEVHMGHQKVPKSDFQSHFSMSKIIWIFLIFFLLKNISSEDVFCYCHFLKTSIFEPLCFLKWHPIFDGPCEHLRKSNQKIISILLIFLQKSTPCWLTSAKLHHWGHTNKDKRVQLKDKTLLYKILYFQDHAISSHPNCFVLFGHTEIVVQEVTIGDPKREYYIEVKANAVPTKEELAHALASIEQPMEGWRTFQNWFLSHLSGHFSQRQAKLKVVKIQNLYFSSLA